MATTSRSDKEHEFDGMPQLRTRVKLRAVRYGEVEVGVKVLIVGPWQTEVRRVIAESVIPWSSWVDGLRVLAAEGLLPIGELALGRSFDQVADEPSVLAATYAADSTESVRDRLEAPEGHAFWSELRNEIAKGFYMGWYAAMGRAHVAR